MDSESSNHLINYSKETKNICLCTTISIVLIMLFVISPLNNFLIASLFGKIAILLILGYALYKNVVVTNQFAQNTSLFSGSWNNTKTNIVSSYIFSLFIAILFFTVLKKIIF